MDKLTEAVLLFAQGAISGLPQAEPDFCAARALLAQHKTLRADSVALWPAPTRSALGRLLGALVMTFELDRLARGSAYLDHRLAAGTHASRLGEPLVAYILNRADALESLDQQARPSPPATPG